MVHRFVVVGSLCVNVCVWSSEWVVRGLSVALFCCPFSFFFVVVRGFSFCVLHGRFGGWAFCGFGGPLVVGVFGPVSRDGMPVQRIFPSFTWHFRISKFHLRSR